MRKHVLLILVSFHEVWCHIIYILTAQYTFTTLIKKQIKNNKIYTGQVLVAHASNPSYLGGKDQENCGLKPARANSSQDPSSIKIIIKKGLVECFKM
jgi:hypothetical protein